MFTMPGDDLDISKDILVEQLIRESFGCITNHMWDRKLYNTYTQYLYVVPITDKSNLIFRIYYYKTHDHHVLNVCMSRNNGEKYIAIYTVEGSKILELIKEIEKNPNSYKDVKLVEVVY